MRICGTETVEYRPRDPTQTDLYRLLQDNLETVLQSWDSVHQPRHGFIRPEVREALEHLLQCGVARFGVAKFECPDCQDSVFVPLSCGLRGLCPSCHAKRQAQMVFRLVDELLDDVPYRHWTISFPKALRTPFRFDTELFKDVTRIVVRLIRRFFEARCGISEIEPSIVVWDHTFGTFPDTYHPHLHLCVSDGGFNVDGQFVSVKSIKKKELVGFGDVLRRQTYRLFIRKEKLSDEFAEVMSGWCNSGFGVHAGSRIRQNRRKRLEQMLMYMSRHPFNPKGIQYDAKNSLVHYRPGRKHPKTGERVITFEANEFIALLAQHIPHARKHKIRFYGAANPKVRKRLDLSVSQPVARVHASCSASRGRKNWAEILVRIFGVDPLVCPCGGRRRLVAVIFNDQSLMRILEHGGQDSRLPKMKPARAPPVEDEVPPARELDFEPDLTDFEDIWWEAEEWSDVQTDEPQPVEPKNEVTDVRSLPSQTRQEILLDLIKRFDGKLCFGNDLRDGGKTTKLQDVTTS